MGEGQPRLLDPVRDRIRREHSGIGTAQAHVDWIRCFVLHHDQRHPELFVRLGTARASRRLPTGIAPVPRVGSCRVPSCPTFARAGIGWGRHVPLARVRWVGGSGWPRDSGPWLNGRWECRSAPHGQERRQRASRCRPRTHRPAVAKRRSAAQSLRCRTSIL